MLRRTRPSFEYDEYLKNTDGNYLYKDKYSCVTVRRTYRDLTTWLQARLRDEKIGEEAFNDVMEGGVSFMLRYPRDEHNEDEPIPGFRWISVYAVTGGSEGHYVHVDLQVTNKRGEMEHTNVYLAKTFHGLSAAYEACAILAELLGV